MKIYFSAAIYYKMERGRYYDRIVKALEKDGHKVLSYGVNTSDIAKIVDDTEASKVVHYKKVSKWIVEADVVVVEASFPSTLHIGHEITLALDKGKPVVVLYESGYKPFFLFGSNLDKLFLAKYEDKNLEKILLDSINYASDQIDTRFNFFISPQIGAYLDWVSKKRRVPRAVYLRKLIENEMKENKDYNQG